MMKKFMVGTALALLMAMSGATAQTITSFDFTNPLRQDYVPPDPTQDRLIDYSEINACPTNGQVLKQNASGEWACAADESGTGGIADGVVNSVAGNENAGVLTVTLGRTVGGPVSGQVQLSSRATKADTDLQNVDSDLTEAEQTTVRTRIGASDFAGLTVTDEETEAGTGVQGLVCSGEGIDCTVSGTDASVIVHGNRQIPLTYSLANTATDTETQLAAALGPIFEAHTDFTMRRFRFVVTVPAGAVNFRTFSGLYGLVDRVSATSYPAAEDMSRAQMRNVTEGDVDYVDELIVRQCTACVIEALVPNDGLSVSAGEFYAVGVTNLIAGANPRPPFLHVFDGDTAPEDSHIGDHAFPFTPFSWVAKWSRTDADVNDGDELYHNARYRDRVEVDYESGAPGLFRVDRNGVQQFVGSPHLNYVGNGCSVTPNAVTGAADVTCTGGTTGTQSNWTETDNTSAAFILNKPSLGSAANRNVGNASGELAALGSGGVFGAEHIPPEIARLASPALTGNPTAPTPATTDDDTSIATTAFVAATVAGFGSAANRNVGNASGELAALGSGGVFGEEHIPDLSASKITRDTMATARLGSGTASATTFLRGDQTWATVAAGGTNVRTLAGYAQDRVLRGVVGADPTWQHFFTGMNFPAEDGVLAAPTAAEYASNRRGWNNEEFVIADRRLTSAAGTVSATWTEWDGNQGMPADATFHGFTYSTGAHGVPQTDGTVIYNYDTDRWRRNFGGGSGTAWRDWQGPHTGGFDSVTVGRVEDRAHATEQATGNNQLAIYAGGNPTVIRGWVSSAFSESQATYEYFWTPIANLPNNEALYELLQDFGPAVRHDVEVTAGTFQNHVGWSLEDDTLGANSEFGTPPATFPDDQIRSLYWGLDHSDVDAGSRNRLILEVHNTNPDPNEARYRNKEVFVGDSTYEMFYHSRGVNINLYRSATGHSNPFADGTTVSMNIESGDPRTHPDIREYVWNATGVLSEHGGVANPNHDITGVSAALNTASQLVVTLARNEGNLVSAPLTLPTGGAVTDLTNVNTDILPNADTSHNVGTTARTFASGHFNALTADSLLVLGTRSLGDSYVSHTITDQQVTFTQADGSTRTLDIPASGTATDLTNVATNILPDEDNRHSVGTSARTFAEGHFSTVNVDGTLTVESIEGNALENVGNSILPDSDGAHGVGSSARTFAFGHFDELTVDSTLNMPDGAVDADAIAGNAVTVSKMSSGTAPDGQILTSDGSGTPVFESPIPVTMRKDGVTVYTGIPDFDITGGDIVNVTPDLVNGGVDIEIVNTRRNFSIPNANVAGTANAIELTTGRSISELRHGDVLYFTSSTANTGATTVAVDGLSAEAIERSNGVGGSSPLTGNEITANDPVMLVYTENFGGLLYFLPVRSGTAAFRNVGTAANELAALGTGGRFPTAQLGSGTASATTFLRGDGAWEVPPTGSGGGLTEAQVDARIAPYARATPSGQIGTGQLADGTASENTFLRGDQTWAAPPAGSTPTDLTSIATNVTPSSDNSGAVGTLSRTWANGRFTALTVDGRFTATGGNVTVGGITVQGDLDAQNDIQLGDRDQIILGSDADATFDFDDRTSHVEIRLNTGAQAFVLYDGTGTVTRHQFNRDGTTVLGGNVTVGADGDILPSADDAGSVGSVNRTWGDGHFDSLTVGGSPVGTGGAGAFSRTEIASVTSPSTAATAHAITLSEPITSGTVIEFHLNNTGAAPDNYTHLLSDVFLSLPAQTTTPTAPANSVALKVAREADTALTSFGHSSLYIWRGATNSEIYLANARDTSVPVVIYQTVMGGPQGPAGADGAPGTGDDAFAWATEGNTDTVPPAKLAPDGTVAQVLTRTAAGQEWADASGGGGGATITDADIDVDDPTTESTTVGASRQAIAEAIADNAGGGGTAAVQSWAAEGDRDTQSGIDEYVRQQVFGNQRVAQHISVAPVGANEAVLFRGTAVSTPASRNGHYITSDPAETAEWRGSAHLSGLNIATDWQTLNGAIDATETTIAVDPRSAFVLQQQFTNNALSPLYNFMSLNDSDIEEGEAPVGTILRVGTELVRVTERFTPPVLNPNAGGFFVERAVLGTSAGLVASGAAVFIYDHGDDIDVNSWIRIDTETVRVTEIGEINFTVDRGHNGTTAAAHVDDSGLDLYLRREPKTMPGYMTDSGQGPTWVNYNFTLQGENAPYITSNIFFPGGDAEFKQWEDLILYMKYSRADGEGTVVEGLMPWNVDQYDNVGADNRGDPYSSRLTFWRYYTGLPLFEMGNPQNWEGNFFGDSGLDPLDSFPGEDDPRKTFLQALWDWLHAEDGYHIDRLDNNSADYEAITDNTSATYHQLEPFLAHVEIAIINGAHPGFDPLQFGVVKGPPAPLGGSEVLYESSADETYTNGTWSDFDVSRELEEQDDYLTISVGLMSSSGTDRWEWCRIPVGEFRGFAFNTQAGVDHSARCRITQGDGTLATAEGTSVYVSRLDADTWRIGGPHLNEFDRHSVRLH